MGMDGSAAVAGTAKDLIRFARVPNMLIGLPRWACWQWRERADKSGVAKRTKVPYNVRTGQKAWSNDPTTWPTYEDAIDAYSSDYDGIGFMLGDGFAGIDLDHCVAADGTIAEWALRLVQRLPGAYFERSPTGTGLKGIFRGTLPAGPRRLGDIEMYDRGRFFTVTGNHLPDTSFAVDDCTASIAAIHAEVFPAKARPPKPSRAISGP